MEQIRSHNCYSIELPFIKDEIGASMTIIENNLQIPFAIKGVYYIYDFQHFESMRGTHAHKELEQLICCVKGSCELLLDDGTQKEKILLDIPNEAVYVGIDVWHSMTGFSNDCVLLILASGFYKEEDYIRHYEEFKKYVELKYAKKQNSRFCY